MIHLIQKGTPIYFEGKLIGIWTEPLETQDLQFFIRTTPPIRVLNQDDSISLTEYAIGFKISYVLIKDTGQPFMVLSVDTLNGLRYVRQFLPEDSVLKKLPR